MKSLFIVNDFPPILGGQSSYYFDICRAFNREEIIVMAPAAPGYQDVDRSHNLRIVRKSYLFPVPVIGKICKIVLPLMYSLELIKKEKLTCVHCGHVLSTGLAGVMLQKLTGVPYIVYTHSADILEYQKYFLIKRLLLCVLKNAGRVVCNSRFTMHKLEELGVPLDKITLLYPKTDVERFERPQEPFDKGRHGLQGKKIIVSINRLVERKGNDTVIRAMPKIISEVPDAVYVIGGAGPYLEKLRSLVKELHLESKVVFLGTVSGDDLAKVYQMGDVFVMNSRNIKDQDTEGFGTVFLEAAACAKPVVGGRSGGVPEALDDGQTGFLVDPLNVAELADVLIKLLKDKKLSEQLGANGKKRVLEKFDRRLLVGEINALMDSV